MAFRLLNFFSLAMTVVVLAGACAAPPPDEWNAPNLCGPFEFPTTADGSLCAPASPTFNFCEWISSSDVVFSGSIKTVAPISEPLFIAEDSRWQSVAPSDCGEIHDGLRFTVVVDDAIGFDGDEIVFSIGGQHLSDTERQWCDDGFRYPNGKGFGRGQHIAGLLHRFDDGTYSMLGERPFTFAEGRILFPTRSVCVGHPTTELDFGSFDDVHLAAQSCGDTPRAGERRGLMRLNVDRVFRDAAMCFARRRPDTVLPTP